MEENKVPLSNSLVKALAWTHNMSVNKLGYSPLQLVTGKAVRIPGLNTGKDIKEIRKADKDDNLTKQEIKEYRKVTGKLSWLANSTRPDLSYTALAMSKCNNSAKISDLRNISRVLKKVRERGSKIKFSKIASRDELIIIGIGDASFKSEEKAVGGVLLFLANSSMTKASPIY